MKLVPFRRPEGAIYYKQQHTSFLTNRNRPLCSRRGTSPPVAGANAPVVRVFVFRACITRRFLLCMTFDIVLKQAFFIVEHVRCNVGSRFSVLISIPRAPSASTPHPFLVVNR